MFNTCSASLSSLPRLVSRISDSSVVRWTRVLLSLPRVHLVVALPPYVYKLSYFVERALSSFSCGIQTFSLLPRVDPLQDF